MRTEAIAAANYIPVFARRITAASAGTQVALADIPKKNTSTSNSVIEYRHTNVTATLAGGADSKLLEVTTPGAVGAATALHVNGNIETIFETDEKLVLQPGEGFLIRQESAADADHRFKLLVEWDEEVSAPSSQGEYLYSSSNINGSTTNGYVYAHLYNPATSGKDYTVKRVDARVDAAAAALYVPISARRTTYGTGGTLVTAADIPKKHTGSANSSAEIRHTNASVSPNGPAEARLSSVTTPGAVGVDSALGSEIILVAGDELILRPGEGLAIMQEAAGDADFRVRLRAVWSETAAKPIITGIAPATGRLSGGTPFSLSGYNFDPTATVTIGGNAATNIHVVSSSTITGLAPAGTAGAKDVVVTNPSSQATTLSGGYTYTANYEQLNKTVSADFSSGTLTNLQASGIKIDEGVFQWLDSTQSTTGGSMAAGTYYYAVTATDFAGNETTRSIESRGVTTTGSTSSVALKWWPVPGATGYKIYRTTTSGTYTTPALITTISSPNSSTIKNFISHTDTAASASSAAPPGVNGTNGELTFKRYNSIPNTFTAGPAVIGTVDGVVNSGSHSLQRPDGKFLIIQGAATPNTGIYDPVANSFAAGPTIVGTAANLADFGHSLQRPDGKFLVVLTNISTNTSIYDPVANTFTAGPALSGNARGGSHAIQRPDGKFLIVHGNATNATTIYDPITNTMAVGPALVPTTAGNMADFGSHSIQRPDGKFLVVIGGGYLSSSIYDPVANTAAAGPALASSFGASVGAHAIQRPNGTFLVVVGNASPGQTNIYDPIGNTFTNGPTLVGTAANTVESGAHSLQRPDGKWLIVMGGTSAAGGSSNTSIYDPVANSFVAGPAIVGTASGCGATPSNARLGAHSLQRPDGKWLVIIGNGQCATSIYDAGWMAGTTAQNGTVGTYTSEALLPDGVSTLYTKHLSLRHGMRAQPA